MGDVVSIVYERISSPPAKSVPMKIRGYEFRGARPGCEVKENLNEVSIVPGLVPASATLKKNYGEWNARHCGDTAHAEGRADYRHATNGNVLESKLRF